MTDKKRLLTYTYNIDYLLFLYSNDGYANAPHLYLYMYIYSLVQRYRQCDEQRVMSPPTFLKNKTKTKLRGLSPHANYTDRAAAAGRRS